MDDQSLDTLRRDFIAVADATYAFQGALKKRLREIDRKALNAQVLVKRHGKELAGYGVVAQAFREGAQAMQTSAEQVQKLINPLMLHFMETLRDAQQMESLRNIHNAATAHCPSLAERMRQHADMQDRHAAGSRRAGLALSSALGRFQSVIAELDYVVVNGRIEAALKGTVSAPLAQVSLEMDRSVSGVQELLRTYREQIERIIE
ncbi:chemotaxis protein [Thiomonas arsenitoxydans]|uniref:chemotaxis protein n=1 Tax=Thiomonas arsenitoxydans (strain DSM 22701 / CIP 110005 / 3As) TaxID=426114 RepID=UPI001ACD943B|nr:chemotaxis protein [Thiomonas arsenitoxydans]MBN8775566.1 chemotaxis protein [Thiomonas arsenitoxydans]